MIFIVFFFEKKLKKLTNAKLEFDKYANIYHKCFFFSLILKFNVSNFALYLSCPCHAPNLESPKKKKKEELVQLPMAYEVNLIQF